MKQLLLNISLLSVLISCGNHSSDENTSKDSQAVNIFKGDVIVKEIYTTVFIGTEEMDFGQDMILEDDGSNRAELRRYSEILIDKVKSNELKAFSTAEIGKELSKERLNNIWVKHDTMYVENGLNTDAIPFVDEFDVQDISHLRFKENWYFDENNSFLKKEVLEICPMTANFASNGDYRGKTPLFWIKIK